MSDISGHSSKNSSEPAGQQQDKESDGNTISERWAQVRGGDLGARRGLRGRGGPEGSGGDQREGSGPEGRGGGEEVTSSNMRCKVVLAKDEWASMNN